MIKKVYRNKFNKYLFRSVINNKMAVTVFLLMSILLLTQYSRKESGEILGYWCAMATCFGVYRTNNIYAYCIGILVLVIDIYALIIYIQNSNVIWGIFLTSLFLVLSLFKIVSDTVIEYKSNNSIN